MQTEANKQTEQASQANRRVRQCHVSDRRLFHAGYSMISVAAVDLGYIVVIKQ